MSAQPSTVIEVVEGSAGRRRANQCVLNKDIRFDAKSLQAATFTVLDDVDTDLLVVISAVAYADRKTMRRLGRGWPRSITLSIPVFNLETWRKVELQLTSLLRILTGDAWTLEFRRREQRNRIVQGFIPGLSDQFAGATIIPYSDGLDSLTGVARLRKAEPDCHVLLVNARRGQRNTKVHSPNGIAVVGVPFATSVRRGEVTYRSRTLVYYSLAALAWRRNRGKRIWIGEGGIGCLGPSLVPFGIEQPVRGSHPAFTKQLSELLAVLWSSEPRFEFPHLWSTKGSVLAQLKDEPALAGWRATKSCSRNHRRQHPGAHGSHCGLCTGCLFRRVAIHAAKLGSEQPGVYFEDILVNAKLSEQASQLDKEIGICSVIAMDELARLDVDTRGADIAELAVALGQPVHSTKAMMKQLIKTHANEWHRFLARLPRNSWVRTIARTGGVT